MMPIGLNFATINNEDTKSAYNEINVSQLQPMAGWVFNYNINSDMVKTTTTGLGSVTQNNGMAILSTGEAENSSAKIETLSAIRYTPGIGVECRFAEMFYCTEDLELRKYVGVSGSYQIEGIGDNENGLYFGFNGEDFGVMKRRNGEDLWIPQEDFNLDKLDGNGNSGFKINPSLGNIYYIKFQWLGFGIIEFGVENPKDGKMIIAHRINYPNSENIPSIFNPTLPLMAEVKNFTNNTNVTLKTSAAMGFLEGQIGKSPLELRKSINSFKSGVSTEINILTIRNKNTYQTKINRVLVNLDLISISTDGTKNSIFKIIKNGVLSGIPVFLSINENTSVIEYSVSDSVVTSGVLNAVITLSKVDSKILDLDSLNIKLLPGESINIVASSVESTEIYAGLSWEEMF